MPIERGDDVSARFNLHLPRVDPDQEHFTVPQLTSEAQDELVALENEARNRLRAKYGAGYEDSVQAWRIKYSDLDPADRDRILGRIEELRGLRDVLEEGDTGIGPHMIKDIQEGVRGTNERAFGRYSVDLADHLRRNHGRVDPNAVWYANTTIQYYGRQLTGLAHEYADSDAYRAAGRQLTTGATAAVAQQLEGLREGGMPKRYTVFDVETPGLRTEEGIHELAFRAYEEGRPIGPTQTFQFPNNFMRLGVVGDQHRLLSEDISKATGRDFTEYEDGLDQFFRQLRDTDWTAVGHNIPFDFERILYGAKRTHKYAEEPEFRDLVSQFEHTFGHEQNKVYDTNILASLLMPLHEGIQIAPELMKADETYAPHSLANILLQTDLLDRLMHEEGGPSERDLSRMLLRQRTHSADVDTELEGHLFRYLAGVAQGTKQVTPTPLKNEAWRTAIAHSRARGPRIRMGYEDVSKDLYPLLEREGLINHTARTADLTPLEQMVLLSRQGRTPNVRPENVDVIASMRRMRQFEQRVFTPSGNVGRLGETFEPPSFRDYQRFQGELMGEGVPFSHLSYVERHATSFLARGTGARTLDADLAPESRAALAEYFGRIHLHGVKQAQAYGSGVVAMPSELLEEAFGADHPSMRSLALSPFRYNKEGNPNELYNMGAMFMFQRGDEGLEQARHLAEVVNQSIGRYGITAEQAARISHSLASEDVLTRGIQVASLTGGAGAPTGTEAANLVQQFTAMLGVDVDDTGDNKVAMGLQYLAGERPDEQGLQRFGPVVMRKGYTEEAAQANRAEVARGDELFNYFRGNLSDRHLQDLQQAATISFRDRPPVRTSVRQRLVSATEEITGTTPKAEIEQRWQQIYETFTRPALLGGAAAATLALGGYYLMRRHQDNKQIDEVTAEQPYETTMGHQAPQFQTGAYLPTTPVARTTTDVMKTAGVVKTQHRRRTGHTRMGANKYNYLYGGQY